MREVVDGVIEVPIAYVHAYAVVVDDGVVLVDTGLAHAGDASRISGMCCSRATQFGADARDGSAAARR